MANDLELGRVKSYAPPHHPVCKDATYISSHPIKSTVGYYAHTQPTVFIEFIAVLCSCSGQLPSGTFLVDLLAVI